MKNHYFIGIGGTGGNILREIRKALFVRKQSEGSRTGSSINCEFLYVDSNSEELNSSRWSILGTSVQLDMNQRLAILEGDLNQVVSSIGQRPSITGWIGRRETILDLIATSSGVPGAQQRRRFGRFLFAVHAQQFVERIKRGIADLMTSREEVAHECTFHLMGTLAGGTGSGGLVDAALLLRNAFPNAASFPIKLYCLVTDSAAGGADVGYFYPNQYAALKDINGVLSGLGSFHDVLSPHGGKSDAQARNPILVCYLTSHSNESNIALDKARQERLIAEWVVEVSDAEATGRIDPQHLKTLTGEDLLPAFPGEPLSKVERSYAFASLGIRRWAIPQSLLRESIACAVARALADQMLFANWSNGYQSELRPANSTDFLQQNSPASVGVDYRQLADPEAGEGRSIDNEWAVALRNHRTRLEVDDTALQQLELAAQGFAAGAFLGSGVRAYFAARKNQIATDVRRIIGDICNRLEAALARRDIGVEDIILCIEAYMKHAQMQFELLQNDEAGKKQLAADADSRMDALRAKWQKPGILAGWLGARKTLLDQAVTALASAYAAKSWLEGGELARLTLQQVIASLQAVHAGVVAFKSSLISVRRDLIEQAGQANRHLQARDDLMKAHWDAKALATLEESILSSETYMPAAAQEAHEKILQGVGLTAFASRCNYEQIKDLLVAVGDQSGLNAHEHFSSLYPNQRVLNENIVRALQRQYGARPAELQREVESFVKGAVTALRLDGAAVPPSAVLGASAPPMPKRGLLLLIPAAQDNDIHMFRKDLIKIFSGCIPNGADLAVEESPEISEITLIAANRWLAARFAAPLPGLKAKYTAAMNTQHLNAAYFCNLDDESGNLPDLFLPDTAAVREEARGWLDIAQRLKIIETDGSGVLVLMRMSDEGVVLPERLGTQDQALSRTDAEVARFTADIKKMTASVDQARLVEAEQQILREQKDLPQRLSPLLPEYQTELKHLQWMRDQVRALIKR